jgi:hypothetical protein
MTQAILDPPYVSPVNIMFRGGAGGNFVNYVLEKFIYNTDPGPDTILDNNEYNVTRTHSVRNTHLNMWFQAGIIKTYGAEVYCVSRYHAMINAYKSTKVIFIQPYNNYLFTEAVCSIKNNVKPTDAYIQQHWKENDKHKQYDRHYKRASAIFKKHGINVYNINYAKLFKFDTENEVRKLCAFLEQDYNAELVTACQLYNQKNEQLLAQYNVELIDNNQ